jgi:hypothetical protein
MLAQSGRVNKIGAKWQNKWRTKLKSAYTNATYGSKGKENLTETINLKQKKIDYSKTLIQQIDTMSSVASAFFKFCLMPAVNETVWLKSCRVFARYFLTKILSNFESDERNYFGYGSEQQFESLPIW